VTQPLFELAKYSKEPCQFHPLSTYCVENTHDLYVCPSTLRQPRTTRLAHSPCSGIHVCICVFSLVCRPHGRKQIHFGILTDANSGHEPSNGSSGIGTTREPKQVDLIPRVEVVDLFRVRSIRDN
jgi:hypothetical protein